MRIRRGPGPVFQYEMILLARRWQQYAARVVFALGLMVGLVCAWYSVMDQQRAQVAGVAPARISAQLGGAFFHVLVPLELILVMLAGPALTAGTICVDRARGVLSHLMTTDLSDVEIVLEKFATRLISLLILIFAGAPVLAWASLLGGIDPNAVVAALCVITSVGLLGCALALFVAVFANKAHEVVTAVYAVWIVWLLSLPVYSGITGAWPGWLAATHPIQLAYNPYGAPGIVDWTHILIFSSTLIALSALAVLFTIRRLRRTVIEAVLKRRETGFYARVRRVEDFFGGLLPGPSLDANPVLWREWNRLRPSRVGLVVWTLFWIGYLFFLAWSIVDAMRIGVNQTSVVPTLILGTGIGFLLIAVAASTSLSEERNRGSLDVLMTTPLTTRAIVVAKWWGVFRGCLPLAAVVLLGSMFLAAAAVPEGIPAGFARTIYKTLPTPIQTRDRLIAPALTTMFVLADGAVIASLGVALATWVKRGGRAIALCVVIYLAVAIAWPIGVDIFNAVVYSSNISGTQAYYYDNQWKSNAVATLSPLGSVGSLMWITRSDFPHRGNFWIGASGVLIVKIVLALGLLELTIATFDGAMGRSTGGRDGDSIWTRPMRLHASRKVSASSARM